MSRIYQAIHYSYGSDGTNTVYIGENYFEAVKSLLSSDAQKLICEGDEFTDSEYETIPYPAIDHWDEYMAIIVWNSGKAVKQKVVKNKNKELTGADATVLLNIFDKTTWKRL